MRISNSWLYLERQLDRVLSWLDYSESEAESQVRWAAANCIYVLYSHNEARSRLAEDMALGRTLGCCINTIEDALVRNWVTIIRQVYTTIYLYHDTRIMNDHRIVLCESSGFDFVFVYFPLFPGGRPSVRGRSLSQLISWVEVNSARQRASRWLLLGWAWVLYTYL